jgi:hypothetical protein
MRESRLEIHIYDNEVIFHGIMTIVECYDFLNYFDKEGFKKIMWGEENSCLRLTRKANESEKIYTPEDFCSRDEVFRFYEERDVLKKRITELESLLKQVINQNKIPENDNEKIQSIQ